MLTFLFCSRPKQYILGMHQIQIQIWNWLHLRGIRFEFNISYRTKELFQISFVQHIQVTKKSIQIE